MAVLLGIVCAFMAGKHYYDAHVSSFKDSARQKFVQILEQELVKREDMEQPIWSNRPRSVLSKNEMVKDTVKLILPKIGQRTYVIPLHRRLNNLEEVPEYRIMQSYILLHSPLRADTLLRLWQKSVSNSGHRLSVRVGVTDFLEKETFSYIYNQASTADQAITEGHTLLSTGMNENYTAILSGDENYFEKDLKTTVQKQFNSIYAINFAF